MNEELSSWLEQIDQAGPAMPLEIMEQHLQEAPDAVKTTASYQYIQGLADGRALHEKFGGIS